jgi:hypothetical protein
MHGFGTLGDAGIYLHGGHVANEHIAALYIRADTCDGDLAKLRLVFSFIPRKVINLGQGKEHHLLQQVYEADYTEYRVLNYVPSIHKLQIGGGSKSSTCNC